MNLPRESDHRQERLIGAETLPSAANMLSSLVAASRQSNAALARLSRAFSASAISATDALQAKDSPFLRFGNPVPSDVGMNQHLSALPETKVRGWIARVSEFLAEGNYPGLILACVVRAW